MSQRQDSQSSTATERAFDWLIQEVVSTAWNKDAFFSESEIARAAGVSRTPAREALLHLEANGLLRRVPFKGAYVPALTETDINEIMEVRAVIGDWATAKVASQNPEIGFLLLEIIGRQREAISDPVKFIDLDLEFHKMLVQAAGNETLENLYASQRYKQQRLRIQALINSQERATVVLAEHTEMAEAVRAGDPDRARRASNAHVASTQRALNGR